MPTFDDRAWVQVRHLYDSRPAVFANEDTPKAALQELLDGWDLVVAHESGNTSDPSDIFVLRAVRLNLYVFEHPTMCVALLLCPHSRYTTPSGRPGWRTWAQADQSARMHQMGVAVRNTALIAPNLTVLVEQMVAVARNTTGEELDGDNRYWAGHATRVLPAALDRMDPDTRASYEVLAGLGAFSH